MITGWPYHAINASKGFIRPRPWHGLMEGQLPPPPPPKKQRIQNDGATSKSISSDWKTVLQKPCDCCSRRNAHVNESCHRYFLQEGNAAYSEWRSCWGNMHKLDQDRCIFDELTKLALSQGDLPLSKNGWRWLSCKLFFKRARKTPTRMLGEFA